MKDKEHTSIVYRIKPMDYWIWIDAAGTLPENGSWCIATNLDDFKLLLFKYGHAQKYSFAEDALKTDCLKEIKERFEGQATIYEGH
jgi:hypothetical protein